MKKYKALIIIIAIIAICVVIGVSTFKGSERREIYVQYCVDADNAATVESCGSEYDMASPEQMVSNLETYGYIVNSK